MRLPHFIFQALSTLGLTLRLQCYSCRNKVYQPQT